MYVSNTILRIRVVVHSTVVHSTIVHSTVVHSTIYHVTEMHSLTRPCLQWQFPNLSIYKVSRH